MSDISKKQATCRGLLVTRVTSPSEHGWSDQGEVVCFWSLAAPRLLPEERGTHLYINVLRRFAQGSRPNLHSTKSMPKCDNVRK